MEFKKGDKVRINTDRCVPMFPLNKEVTIIIHDPLSDALRYCVEDEKGNSMWVPKWQLK